eukprot:CAMPEP_0171461060 /NCGR_PEP_ID=MMETSP0945-20130129/5666_1 /TAXON_ID=109269 /ORGANISM="Vaucheria litorea, Strain CCMP2940" /LENGTH=482 /DNA_ID=CAMNT_0011987345 /DNA_START=202 /DNA_END=1650 /DNA_ORIENTATION=-
MEQLISSSLSGNSWNQTLKSSSILQGTITSGAVFGAMIGSLMCFELERKLGRRVELMVSAFLYGFGAIIEWASGMSTFMAGVAIPILLVGRIVYGMGAGFAMHGAPAYISEMSPPSIRGILVGMKEVFIVLGILVGYVAGFFFENTEGGWRSVYSLALVPAIFQFTGMWFMPSSTRWLMLVGRRSEAFKSLTYVNPVALESTLDEIQLTLAGVSDNEGGGIFELWSSNCRPALICGVGIVLLQQFTGQPSVLYYADTIFADVGLSSIASILTGSFKLCATLYAVFNADKRGRKSMLKVGCWLMLIALVLLTVAFMSDYVSAEECNMFTTEDMCTAFSSQCAFESGCSCSSVSIYDCTCCDVVGINIQKASILAAMFLYIGGYQVGFGPMGWLIISEIFPLELRGKAISIAVVANFASNLLVTFIFPIEMELIGVSLTFLVFALIDIYALYFISKKVPETKGLSLEQIEKLFQRIAYGERIRD